MELMRHGKQDAFCSEITGHHCKAKSKQRIMDLQVSVPSLGRNVSLLFSFLQFIVTKSLSYPEYTAGWLEKYFSASLKLDVFT